VPVDAEGCGSVLTEDRYATAMALALDAGLKTWKRQERATGPGEQECRKTVAQGREWVGLNVGLSPGFTDSIDRCTLISRGE
jgi:hypothetical protein